jgi:hypothetical protein
LYIGRLWRNQNDRIKRGVATRGVTRARPQK